MKKKKKVYFTPVFGIWMQIINYLNSSSITMKDALLLTEFYNKCVKEDGGRYSLINNSSRRAVADLLNELFNDCEI